MKNITGKYKVSMNVRNQHNMLFEKTVGRFVDEMDAILFCMDHTGSKKLCISEWNGKRWVILAGFMRGERI